MSSQQPPVTVVVCTNQGCTESHHSGAHSSSSWSVGTLLRNVLGSAAITAAVVGAAVGLYRRHRRNKRETLERRLRFLTLHRFSSERDAIISAILRLGRTPFDAATLGRIHSSFLSLLEDPERGVVTASRFRALCPSLSIDPDDSAAVEAAFRLLDSGRDSVIDFLELVQWLSTACAAPDADVLAAAYAAVDVEGRGEMGEQELRAVVRALAPMERQAGTAEEVADGICTWLRQTSVPATTASWRAFAESPIVDIVWTFAFSEVLCRRFGVDFTAVRDSVAAPEAAAAAEARAAAAAHEPAETSS